MSSLHARFVSMTAALRAAGEASRTLNNRNANNNTRIDGWAGV